MKQQSGFTLIELIAVIVILGILAATAIPRFIDLSTSARQATLQGIAGALGSASALNHANNIARDAGLTTATAPVPVATCQAVVPLLDGGLPSGIEVVAGTGTAVTGTVTVATEGGSSRCQVRYTGTASNLPPPAEFIAYGVVHP